MIEYRGEQYITASEVAQHFCISRGTCSNNILPQMQQCYLPGRKKALYKLSDVERHAHVLVVEKVLHPLMHMGSRTEVNEEQPSEQSCRASS